MERKPVECFNCRGNHFAKNCPERRNNSNNNNSSNNGNNSTTAMVEMAMAITTITAETVIMEITLAAITKDEIRSTIIVRKQQQ